MKKILLFILFFYVAMIHPFFATNLLPVEEGNSSLTFGQNSVSYNQDTGRLNIVSLELGASANLDMRQIIGIIENNPDEAALLFLGGGASLLTYCFAPEEYRNKVTGGVVAISLFAYLIKKQMNASRPNQERTSYRTISRGFVPEN